ncbi:hypothetical protein [Streptomyces sp. NPDC005017]|uniref:hypothetical protein n=1 Tax=Streptomyces sp. NPDC005017 TaxID=3364706 RepID=UPI003693AFBC
MPARTETPKQFHDFAETVARERVGTGAPRRSPATRTAGGGGWSAVCTAHRRSTGLPPHTDPNC